MKLRIFLMALAGAALTGCGKDVTPNAPFDNKVYIDSSSKTETMPLKNSFREATRLLKAAVAKPAGQDINLVFAADPSLVTAYNATYYDQAELLGEAHYDLPDGNALLSKGTVRSSEVAVNFRDLHLLDRTKVYVLPVTLTPAGGVDKLETACTFYYVFRGMPLIGMVADMEKKNYVSIQSFLDQKPSAAVCNDLEAFTLEALIRVHKFDPGIQTIMGIEGYFMLRISDNGLEPNQLQYVNPYGNITNEACLLPTEKWVHIAATYDMNAKQVKLYIDGQLAVEKGGLTDTAPVSFGKPAGTQKHSFYIGFAYQPGRELDGLMSELRIWNVVRTPEQIAENPYEVEPDAPGLVAYWKCNEGSGQTIVDHTGNGNDGTAKNPVRWTPVSLPETN